MSIKSYWISMMVWFIAGFLDKCQGSSKLSEFLVSNQTDYLSIPDDNSTENISECRNITGHLFKDGMEFVPEGVDYCKLCICMDGQAMNCRAVLCTPPDCKSFQMGLLCCEFKCLDDLETTPSTADGFEFVPISNSINLKFAFPFLILTILNSFQIFHLRY